MGSVPLESYELVARWDRVGDLARPAELARYTHAEGVAIPLTEERYRISGYDATDAIEDLYFTFVKEDGEWLIADDSNLEELGVLSARHLWDFGPLYAVRSEHFILFGHPCGGPGAPAGDCARVPPSFLDLAEEALARVHDYWSVTWPDRIVVLVPGTEEELSRMLQLTFDVENFVAFASSSVDSTNGVDYSGPRIVFNHESLTTRPSSTVRDVLAHELLHIATRYSSGPFVPVFIEEGIADYVGNDASVEALGFLASEVGGGIFDRALPLDFEFTTGTGTDIFRSYQKSHSAVRFFVLRWGLKRFIRFYRELGSREVRAGTARYHLNDALEEVLGLGYARFQKLWADSLSPT
jgi:hypothetical protein